MVLKNSFKQIIQKRTLYPEIYFLNLFLFFLFLFSSLILQNKRKFLFFSIVFLNLTAYEQLITYFWNTCKKYLVYINKLFILNAFKKHIVLPDKLLKVQ